MRNLNILGWVLLAGVVAVPSARALEAVVQSDVGSGSAVAGSIGAVNSRADALQANQAAANQTIQQLQQRVETLEKIIQQIADVTYGGNGSNGGNGGNGQAGTTEVSATVKLGTGALCGAAWVPGTLPQPTGPVSNALTGQAYRSWVQQYQSWGYIGGGFSVPSIPCNGKNIVLDGCPRGYQMFQMSGGTSAGIGFSGADYSWTGYAVLTCVKQ